MTGIEPVTFRFTLGCSDQLNYIHHQNDSGGIRTCNIRFLKPTPLPVGLRSLIISNLDGRIRTYDLVHPRHTLCQAELHPVILFISSDAEDAEYYQNTTRLYGAHSLNLPSRLANYHSSQRPQMRHEQI